MQPITEGLPRAFYDDETFAEMLNVPTVEWRGLREQGALGGCGSSFCDSCSAGFVNHEQRNARTRSLIEPP